MREMTRVLHDLEPRTRYQRGDQRPVGGGKNLQLSQAGPKSLLTAKMQPSDSGKRKYRQHRDNDDDYVFHFVARSLLSFYVNSL